MANAEVGDLVQIKGGGRDVTNGVYATAGRMYGEGGPLWATVTLIDNNWSTIYGTSSVVTKVRCENNGTCVWQVEPQDIADNIIKANSETQTTATYTPSTNTSYTSTDTVTSTSTSSSSYTPYVASTITASTTLYKTGTESDDWSNGISTYEKYTNLNTSLETDFTGDVGDYGSTMSSANIKSYPSGTWRALNDQERASIGSFDDLLIDDSAINPVEFINPYWEDIQMRYEMLDVKYDSSKSASGGFADHTPNIQNGNNYPERISYPSQYSGLVAEYDFQTHPETDDNLQDLLMKARASLGIQVHGESDLEKAVKHYMYNRWKTPDTSLAHNKCFTHVFFTRPDCNLLTSNQGIVDQARNHSDTSLIWRRYPELFKLLSDGSRIGDRDNFNLLLSNQVNSFPVQSDTLGTFEAGKSWGNHEISYGGMYTGRGAGEFSCTFDETSDYAISNFMKLWITYIDNVSRGAWSPSYDLNLTAGSAIGDGRNNSHVFTKTIDYASSVYMFKVAPNGEDILFFTKYYGVFPTTTGSSAHSWTKSGNIGDTPQLDISFRYSFKREMSLISLLEFNYNANYSGGEFEPSYDYNHFGSSRPFVGTPFVSMSMTEPGIESAQMTNRLGVNNQPKIKLKFRPIDQSSILNDYELYKARW